MSVLAYIPINEIEKVPVYNIPLTCKCWPPHMYIRAELCTCFHPERLKPLAYRKYQLPQLICLINDNPDRCGEALKLDLGRLPLVSRLYVELLLSFRNFLIPFKAWRLILQPAKPMRPTKV